MLDRIVEDSYYDHPVHGRVKVVDVSATTVSLQLVDDDVDLPGIHTVPKGAYEKVSDFKRDAEPADVTVRAEPAVFDIFGNSPGA